ncbi:hypothetical protein Hanom_Chr10g00961621 [Helianthus anomalus]
MMSPHYGQPAQQSMRIYALMPNGYKMVMPSGTMNPPDGYCYLILERCRYRGGRKRGICFAAGEVVGSGG